MIIVNNPAATVTNGSITAPKLSGAQTGSAPIFGIRAWVSFNGTGTVTVRGSANVSSITDNGTGDYTINFATAMPDANYAVCGSSGGGNATSQGAVYLLDQLTARTTALFRVLTLTPAGVSVDTPFIDIMVIR